MTDDQRISELLERVMDGSDPEEACRDFPGLLPEVRQRWHHIRSVQSQLDGLFPSSHAGLDGHGSHGFGTPFARGELPHIPGYHVESLLGSGGIGAVYKAMHLKLKRSVAIKMLILGQYATERELTSLLKEAEAVAALRHPNIVQVHDVGDLDGQPFFTMEYVDGGSLAQKLGGRPLPAREAAKLIMALARAIEAAHSAGIVHRDLKPGNILLSIDGTPKVADFGLARRNEGDAALTLSSARMGTPSYMAPEQALGKPDAFAPAVDVYALGAILYELLTGRPPFSSELTAELLRQVVDEEPVSPLRLNPRLPRDLVTICLRCLQKSPSRRYANASALATDIEHFLNHEPILARPIGSIERGIRWARRKPAAAGLLITAVGLASLLIGVAAAEWNRQAALMAEKRRLTERLQSALQLEQQQQYSEARAILGRLGDAGFPDLRAQIDRALAEVDLVTTLDDLRMSRAMSGHLTFDRTAAQRAYERAFIVAGIGGPGEDPAIVAARISAMSVRSALVAAIDDWVFCTTEAEGRNWLLQVARLADPDPAWRDRVRDPSVWGDAATLSELAQNVNLGDQSVSLLLMFAGLLDRHDQDPVGFLYRVQAAHPGDFFASFVLAETLDGLDNADSIGYYRAAIAVRPRAVAAYVNLGNTLDRLGRADEALDSWERAVAVNPEALAAQYTLALGLLKRQRYEECINHCRKVTEMQSNNVMAHCMWADALIGLAGLRRRRLSLIAWMSTASPCHPSEP